MDNLDSWPCDSLYPMALSIVRRYKINNPPFPISMDLKESDGGCLLTVVFSVRDRDNGTPLDLKFHFQYEWNQWGADKADGGFMAFVESSIRAAWVHELHEFLLFDGVRIFDPHPDKTNMFVPDKYIGKIADHE